LARETLGKLVFGAHKANTEGVSGVNGLRPQVAILQGLENAPLAALG
jgi:hypothetical protein